MGEVWNENEISKEDVKSFLSDNMRRSEKKYGHLSKVICEECNAILELDVTVCPNCGSRNLVGILTDENR